MSQPPFRDRLQAGETVIGTFQLIDSIMVAEMVGIAGLDFVVLDQEHGPLGSETCLRLVAGAQQTGAAPIVRVRANDKPEIQRALDIGAAGVQVPQVETREDAERAAHSARFDPEGNRGLSPYVRAGEYWGLEEYTDKQNQLVTLIVQVEGERGIENIGDILAVDGIDVVFLGPYDLSQSLGVPGNVAHPDVESHMSQVSELARDAGVVVGTYADTPEIARQWIDAGVQYVTVGSDGALLTNQFASVRSAVTEETD